MNVVYRVGIKSHGLTHQTPQLQLPGSDPIDSQPQWGVPPVNLLSAPTSLPTWEGTLATYAPGSTPSDPAPLVRSTGLTAGVGTTTLNGISSNLPSYLGRNTGHLCSSINPLSSSFLGPIHWTHSRRLYSTPEPSSRPNRLKQLPARLRAVPPGTRGISVRVATLVPTQCVLLENQFQVLTRTSL